MSDQHFDVVIIGGAALGAGIAYFLKAVERFPRLVAVVERDPLFPQCPRRRSRRPAFASNSPRRKTSASRQFGLQFLRSLEEQGGSAAGASLHEGGYLILASEGGLEALRDNHRSQTAEGAPILLLEVESLAQRCPWLCVDGIAAGALSLAGEGWFDSHAMLRAFRAGAREAGAVMLTGEAVSIATDAGHVTSVLLADGGRIGCGTLVNAAGPSAGKLAGMAGRPLPVEPRKRTVFVIDCPDALPSLPLIADPSGIWLRPEGRGFITGYSPPELEDRVADPQDFAPDHDIFEETLWPALAARIPAFERLKVTGAWAGHYDYNVLDQNAVIGPDPELGNFIYANGFSGHGLQHAPGVGRGRGGADRARFLSDH
jgi:glycine/D-amino acid oxidase-like deaminating enzyme